MKNQVATIKVELSYEVVRGMKIQAECTITKPVGMTKKDAILEAKTRYAEELKEASKSGLFDSITANDIKCKEIK